MTDEYRQIFPSELLQAPPKERLAYFKSITVDHPALESARTKLHNFIEDADPDSLIFLFGPTGVGKSTLRAIVINNIIMKMLPELRIDLSRIPAVGYELDVPDKGVFNWVAAHKGLLHELNEPLIDRKIAIEPWTPPALLGAERKTVAIYFEAYIQAMKYRRPVACFLDDAHYLNKVPGAARLLNQLDYVKYMASKSQVPHVLLGTYELLTLRNLSGQLSRRGMDIHFRHYRQNDRDREDFEDILITFGLAMPLEECPDLASHLDFLMERSVGCVGILKKWLNLALGDALRSGSKSLTIEHLENSAYSNEALSQMFIEIIEGEKRLANGDENYFINRNKLYNSNSQPVTAQAKTQKVKSKRKPGQRNPTRDPIGDTRK